MLNLTEYRFRRRGRRFRKALAQADIDQTLALGVDPAWSKEALLKAVDSLLNVNRLEELDRLKPLAPYSSPEDVAIFELVRVFARDGATAAEESVHRLQTEYKVTGAFLKWAETWLIFLRMPRPKHEPSLPTPIGPIFQFWDTETPPKDVLREMNKWRNLAKDTGYFRFNARSGLGFLEEHFGEDEIGLFENAIHPAVQSDFLRLCVLKIKGGIYVDADTKVSACFPSLLPSLAPATLWFRTSMAHCRIQNGFLAFKPGHTFVDAMLNKTIERLSADSGESILNMSGPGMATDTFLKTFQRNQT